MVVEGVEISEKVLQRTSEQLECEGVSIVATPQEKLLPKQF